MEPVRMASDFKNAPRIGQKYIQSTAGAVSKKTSKGEYHFILIKSQLDALSNFDYISLISMQKAESQNITLWELQNICK